MMLWWLLDWDTMIHLTLDLCTLTVVFLRPCFNSVVSLNKRTDHDALRHWASYWIVAAVFIAITSVIELVWSSTLYKYIKLFVGILMVWPHEGENMAVKLYRHAVEPQLKTHEELIDENLRQTRQHLRKKMNSLISQSTQFMADHFVTWFSTIQKVAEHSHRELLRDSDEGDASLLQGDEGGDDKGLDTSSLDGGESFDSSDIPPVEFIR